MKQPDEKLTVRFPFGLLDIFRALAKKHKRSLNSEIIWALEQYAQQETKEKRASDN